MDEEFEGFGAYINPKGDKLKFLGKTLEQFTRSDLPTVTFLDNSIGFYREGRNHNLLTVIPTRVPSFELKVII